MVFLPKSDDSTPQFRPLTLYFCTWLRHTGFTLDTPAVQGLMSKFDPDSSGTLTLDEFIRTCLMLQTAARVFGAFDPQRSGSVTFSFSQFVSLCRARLKARSLKAAGMEFR